MVMILQNIVITLTYPFLPKKKNSHPSPLNHVRFYSPMEFYGFPSFPSPLPSPFLTSAFENESPYALLSNWFSFIVLHSPFSWPVASALDPFDAEMDLWVLMHGDRDFVLGLWVLMNVDRDFVLEWEILGFALFWDLII